MLLMNPEDRAQFEQLRSNQDDWEEVTISRVEGGFIIQITHRFADKDGVLHAVVQDRVVCNHGAQVTACIDHVFNPAPPKDKQQ